jgi:hypothetical protein
MKTPEDFKNLFEDFLFTYRQFLLHGYLHKEIDNEIYQKNFATWDTILVSLESGTTLGLAKLLENSYFQKLFPSLELNQITEKITNLRDKFIAHNDLQKMRVRQSYLQANQLFGSDLIEVINAIKQKFIAYEEAQGFNPAVDVNFRLVTELAKRDVEKWVQYFKQRTSASL